MAHFRPFSLALLILSTLNPHGGISAEPRNVRLVFLGDSLTAGFGVDPEQSYPALVEKKIEEKGWNITVVNAGVSGDTTADGLNRLEWVLRGGADIFVLALGANDGLRGVPPAVTKKNLEEIVDRVRLRNSKAVIFLAGMLLPVNMGKDYREEFAAVFQDAAQEKKIAFIPFLLEGVAGIARLNLPDGIHPNPQGYRIVADKMWQALEPELSRAGRVNEQAKS